MYTPAHFRVDDRTKLAAVIRAHSFGLLVTHGAGGLFASHLPFLLDEAAGPHGALRGHMARANPQWRDFSGVEALVVFQGEHGYISPTWYPTGPAVPTWNYQAVHAYGVPRIVDDPAQVHAILDHTIRAYEKPDSGYAMSMLPEGYAEKMSAGIVAFEIPLTRLEGKFKLSQNRSRPDALSAIAALRRSGDASSLELADAMQAVLPPESAP